MSKETQAISNDINQLTHHARALVVATADVANEQVTEAELASRIVLAKRWPLLISGSSGVMLASFSCLTRPLTSPLSTLAILKATHQECAKMEDNIRTRESGRQWPLPKSEIANAHGNFFTFLIP